MTYMLPKRCEWPRGLVHPHQCQGSIPVELVGADRCYYGYTSTPDDPQLNNLHFLPWSYGVYDLRA